MKRCESTYTGVTGRVQRCTKDAQPKHDEHRNFLPGHKIKWPERAADKPAK